MRFELLDSFSLPGDPQKPNEDCFAHTQCMAVVIDGATGLGPRLMPGPSDAQWLAGFAARRLCAHADDGGAPEDWLLAAAADAEKSFAALRRRVPAERYEIPFASLMLTAVTDDRLRLVWFGDCAALLRSGDGMTMIGDTLEARAGETIRARSMSATPAAGVREEHLSVLRASRNRVNGGGDEWLFAPDVGCAAHASHVDLPAKDGARILLATDGFLALLADYRRYEPQGLLAAAERRGLKALGEELRAIEAGDPDGRVYPRFKRSDDATALLFVLNR